MGFTVNFTDNQNVDAEKINNIGKSIDETMAETSFEDDVLYGVDALNSITKSLITKGVSKGCDVICADNRVTISQGTAFFADGKKIEIDADGITLVREENEINYVWLLNDEVTKTITAKCTKEVPSGDYVCLAEISESGMVGGTKDIALMKNASILPNSYILKTVEFSKDTKDKEYTLDLGGNYRRMVLMSEQRLVFIDWDKNIWYRDKNHYVEEFTIAEGTYPSLSYDNDSSVRILSFENNILTYRVNAIYGSGKFVIHCM